MGNRFTWRGDGGFTGQSVRGNASRFAQLARGQEVPGRLGLAGAPPAAPRATPGKRRKRERKPILLVLFSRAPQTLGTNPQGKTDGIRSETCRCRSAAWLGSQNSTFRKMPTLSPSSHSLSTGGICIYSEQLSPLEGSQGQTIRHPRATPRGRGSAPAGSAHSRAARGPFQGVC